MRWRASRAGRAGASSRSRPRCARRSPLSDFSATRRPTPPSRSSRCWRRCARLGSPAIGSTCTTAPRRRSCYYAHRYGFAADTYVLGSCARGDHAPTCVSWTVPRRSPRVAGHDPRRAGAGGGHGSAGLPRPDRNAEDVVPGRRAPLAGAAPTSRASTSTISRTASAWRPSPRTRFPCRPGPRVGGRGRGRATRARSPVDGTAGLDPELGRLRRLLDGARPHPGTFRGRVVVSLAHGARGMLGDDAVAVRAGMAVAIQQGTCPTGSSRPARR